MFNVGSGEFAVVTVVAIIVLGPETCIKYAQKAGRSLRLIQAEWANAKRHFDTAHPEQVIRKLAAAPTAIPQKNSSSEVPPSEISASSHVKISDSSKETV